MDVDLVNAISAAARRGDLNVIGSGCGDTDGFCVLVDGAMNPSEVSAMCEVGRLAGRLRDKISQTLAEPSRAEGVEATPVQVVVETENRTLYAHHTATATIVLAQK